MEAHYPKLSWENVNHQATAHAKTHHSNRRVDFRIGKEVKGDLLCQIYWPSLEKDIKTGVVWLHKATN